MHRCEVDNVAGSGTMAHAGEGASWDDNSGAGSGSMAMRVGGSTEVIASSVSGMTKALTGVSGRSMTMWLWGLGEKFW
jgi:hypothetical protein